MDPDELEQANIRAAIQASLRESQGHSGGSSSRPSTAVPDVVDLTNDSDPEKVQEVFPKSKSVIGSETEDEAEQDEDEVLRQAIAMSLQGPCPKSEAPQLPPLVQEMPKPLGLLGLDRKQMERERLARQASKRKPEDVPALDPPKKVARIETKKPSGKDGPRVAARTPFQAPSVQLSPPTAVDQPATNSNDAPIQPTARPVAQWLRGVVKKTYVSNAPRKGDDITIQEVIQRGDLELAVFSSYLWDMDWLFDNVDTQKTRFILIMNAKEESTVSLLWISSTETSTDLSLSRGTNTRRRRAPCQTSDYASHPWMARSIACTQS